MNIKRHAIESRVVRRRHWLSSPGRLRICCRSDRRPLRESNGENVANRNCRVAAVFAAALIAAYLTDMSVA